MGLMKKAAAPALKHLSLGNLNADLERALVERDTAVGFALLDERLSSLERINTKNPESIALLLSLAQWVDLGYRDGTWLRAIRSRFDTLDVPQLTLLDYLRLKLVDAFICMHAEHLGDAAEGLNLIWTLGEGLLPQNLVFLTHFWKGRLHRRRGEYEHALVHIGAAKKYASITHASKLVAVCNIHEAWIAFQGGRNAEAFTLLDEAEAELKETGHLLSLGNIASARGRFVRRSGAYRDALRHFESAIQLYSRMVSPHPSLARTLANAAYVKRLIALSLRPSDGSVAKGSVHARCRQLTKEALELLQRAETIYVAHDHPVGRGAVLVNTGFLHLENGNTLEAQAASERAFLLGREERDAILMARACNLRSAVELALADDAPDQLSVSSHIAIALGQSEEAIELSTHTQNRRLLAEAYIRRANVAISDTVQDFEHARGFASKASSLLNDEDRDHLYQELTSLKQKLLRSNGIDQTLRLWSNGEVGTKTFREIEEEFAEIVISKVWLNLGKNVTRVAEQLSVSPKKIRRALRNAKQ
jgi:tetratricopeptide (TPR) repeat protein